MPRNDTYIIISKSLQQNQKNALEVFIPQIIGGHVTFPRQFCQRHHGILSFCVSLIMIRQLR
jgi:hypothetical protein